MKTARTMKVKLQVSIIKQGKKFVAYSPALDISTSGKDLKETQKRFEELIDIFFKEIIEKNTIKEALMDLGWVKEKKQWEPPHIVKQESFDILLPVAA